LIAGSVKAEIQKQQKVAHFVEEIPLVISLFGISG
jgi:hypothetical protein